MNKIFKRVLVLALLVFSAFALVACNDDAAAEINSLRDTNAQQAAKIAEYEAKIAELEASVAALNEEAAASAEEYEAVIASYQELLAAEKEVATAQAAAALLYANTAKHFDPENAEGLLGKSVAKDPTFDFSKEQWEVINQLCATAEYVIEFGPTVEAISEIVGQCCNDLMGFFAATGAYSYVAFTYAQRTEILATLEEYAVKYGLTGLTLYSSAGIALYNDGVVLGTDTYIVGYGFGAIAEGGITHGLNYEGMNPAYANYYHSYETEDPANLNYGDDKGSVVGDLVAYVSGSYWGTKMNDDKDGYVWYNDLATTKPVAVADSVIEGTNLATSYSFNVRIGSALKYATMSTHFASYNGREVAMEDYLTPFKLLWTKANGWARATDNHGSSGQLKGEVEYYNASAEEYNAEAFANCGVKIEAIEGSTTEAKMTFTFVTPCNSFYAMYYINSSIYAPVPQEFIDAIGGADVFGKYDTEKGYTPVDTFLSTGVFVTEAWENDSEIVFKKNELNDREPDRYNVEGVHLAILKGLATDKELAFKEFMAGKLSACSVPSTQLENFYGVTTGTSTTNSEVKYYCKQTRGGSTYKLNCNTLDQDTWYKLFGENGSVTQTALADSWECEPIMSNHDFYLGLSYSLDRATYAADRGYDYTVNYFGDVYLSDPEEGIAYNSTEAHERAIASLIADEAGKGYDVEYARSLFSKAIKDCVEAGYYAKGDKIEIEVAWMYASDEEESHNFIKKCWEDAFNGCDAAKEYEITLEVVFWTGSSWSDVYYNKMMVGQFDIGFGSISGNSLNPLNFLEVLRSDNSSGFTLNWGTDTSLISEDLVWDGKIWSFNSLWIAADQGGYFENGIVSPTVTPEVVSCVKNEDGSQTIVIDVKSVKAEGVEVTPTGIYVFAYNASQKYMEAELEVISVDGDVITVKASAEICAQFAAANLLDGGDPNWAGSYHGLDVYYDTKIAKVPGSSITTIAEFIDLTPDAE